MRSGEHRWDIERIRELAVERSEAATLRGAADEIGITLSTLYNFVNGSMPHPRVRRLLQTWYAQQREAARSEGEAAVDAIVRELPASEREGAARELRGFIVDLYRRFGGAPPVWAETSAPRRPTLSRDQLPRPAPSSTTR